MTSSIELAAIFQDRAILQRGQPVAVWGWGPPRARIKVTLGPDSAYGISSGRGRFEIWLPPPAENQELTLEVRAPDLPAVQARTVHGLLAGEVWLASGQSNMAMTLAECAEHGAAAISAANDPDLRFFTVARTASLGPQDDVSGEWLAATPENARNFSAVAWFFAATLRRELGVPVGVMDSSYGGTPIEAWMSRQAHACSRHLAVTTADYHRYAHSQTRWANVASEGGAVSRTFPPDPGRSPESDRWADPDFDDTGWPTMTLPSAWQKHGHDFSGVFWFRRTVSLPDAWRGRDLVVELGAADKQDIAFANGVEIGRTGTGMEDQYWNRPRVYPIPSGLTGSDIRLVLAVRVYSFVYDGGLIGPCLRLRCPERTDDPPVSLDGGWRYAVEHNFGHVPGDHDPGHLTPQSPHILFDNMIAPLAPVGLRGALWYQGERNVAHAESYADHLRDLIADWRRLWGRGDFPWFVVQLPAHLAPFGHEPDSGWAQLRESQLKAARTTPGATIVMALDAGEAFDIHPKNKVPVGQRLAKAALVRVYGHPGTATGPLPLEAVPGPDGIRVRFELDGAGLATADNAAPRTVYLGGPDGRWHTASARIESNELVAFSPDCPDPTAIAYAWAGNPEGANLVNSDGHPASSFRLPVRSTAESRSLSSQPQQEPDVQPA